MAAISIQKVTRQFGKQVVLANVSLEFSPGETVGLVGANGAGKTTLFRLITGELKPDLGTITCARNLKIGYLRQEPDVALERTLHEEMRDVFADLLALEAKLHALSDEIAARHDDPAVDRLMVEYERVNQRFIAGGGYTFETSINEVLGGLGFAPADYAIPISILSGGQKCRAALAKLLLQDRPMLLLDEPTNHLDIDAVRWLEKFLTGRHGGKVLISHDRYLLDRLAHRIVEVERCSLHSFPGNYSNYVKSKEIRLLTQLRQYEKDAEFIRKEEAFIEKHISRQRSKEAKGRRTRLERRLAAGEFVTEKPTTQRRAAISFDPGKFASKGKSKGQTVLRCDELSMSYGPNVLFTDLNLQVTTGQRLGITGPNGTGKTTLLKIILGEVVPIGGEVSLSAKYRIGYYDQEHVQLNPERTAVEEILSADQAMTEQQARSLLARYLFTSEDVFKTLGTLSGGEQSRIRLAKLMLSRPEVLILDEPTNHLDIPSREVLEEALLEFDGTVIVVSHDRYFLDRIVEQLLVIRREGHKLYAGNYSYYIAEVEQQRAEQAAESARQGRKPAARIDKRKQAQRPPSPYDHLSVEELEEMIMTREAELADLNERFGDPRVCKNPAALRKLREQADALAGELAEIDAAWHERADT